MTNYIIFAMIFYAIFVVAFIVYSIAGIYHLWRFGYSGDLSKPAIFLYLLITAVIIVVSSVFIIFNIQ